MAKVKPDEYFPHKMRAALARRRLLCYNTGKVVYAQRRWSDPPAEVKLPFPAWRRGSGTLTGAGSPLAAWISPESIRNKKKTEQRVIRYSV